jgi:hypothetical protein
LQAGSEVVKKREGLAVRFVKNLGELNSSPD